MNRYKSIFFILLILVPGGFQVNLAEDHFVEDRIEKPVSNAIDMRRKSQEEQEEWQKERQKKIALYEQLELENTRLVERQSRLEQSKNATLERIEEKNIQLEHIRQISEQMNPYLYEVLDRLNILYIKDIPFLHNERSRRIDNLTKVLAEPDVTVSEKARKTMEALMVEADYGHTIEIYRETVDIKGIPTLVDVFRLGRIALFYRTLDGNSCGFYNVAAKSWHPLPGKNAESIEAVVEIGAKRRPVELLSLPIGRLSIK